MMSPVFDGSGYRNRDDTPQTPEGIEIWLAKNPVKSAEQFKRWETGSGVSWRLLVQLMLTGH
jgi:hypothetical protein